MDKAEDPSKAAADAYDVFAPLYDDFTYDYENERWTDRLLGKAEQLGLKGRRLLDVGCGTGKSFIPLLTQGWTVAACDVSAAMIEIARSKVGGAAELVQADMRTLPILGAFDLVWALDDAINYLLTEEDLRSAIAGMRANLAPSGLLVFDANTLLTYESFFCTDRVVEQKGRRMTWRGEMAPDDLRPDSVCRASFTVDGDPGASHIHLQRHFAVAEVLNSLEAAGLTCETIVGERDGTLSEPLDEAEHMKAIYFAAPMS